MEKALMYDRNNVVDFNVLLANEQRYHKRNRSGMFGAIKAKQSRKNMEIAPILKKAIPQAMVVTRPDGVQITVPASWFTKTGKVRKGRLTEYKSLLGVS